MEDLDTFDTLDLLTSKIELEISEDRMEAALKVPMGMLPSELEIEHLLRDANVTEGVDLEAITSIANDPQPGIFIVARGTPPGETVDGSLAIFFESNPIPQPKIDDEGRANYFDLGGVPTCDQGEILARKKPGRKGEAGVNVHGEFLDAPTPRDPPIAAGQNTNMVEDEEGIAVIADKAGQPIRRGGAISVRDLYVVTGDLDIAIGNLDYNGSVLIKGSVHEQITIRCKGDITINGNVESATIVCGGDMTVLGGILRESKISVAGSLRARFIERSNIQVDHYLFVKEDLMFSEVLSGAAVEVQSGIIGGRVEAAGYLRTAYIGKRMGTPTAIEVGNQSKWFEKLKKAEALLHEAQESLIKNLEPLQELLLLEARGELEGETLELKLKLEKSVENTRIQIGDRLRQSLKVKALIQGMPHPRVLIPGGTVYPGVQIIIKSAVYNCQSTTKATSFTEHKGEIEIY